MSQFTRNTSIAPIGKLRETTEDITRYREYISEDLCSDPITIPKGFVFDGASIPRRAFVICLFLTVFVSGRFGVLVYLGLVIQSVEATTIKGVLLHDYCYRVHREVGYREANKIMGDVHIACGVPKRKALTMWLGVTLFGWIVWYRLPKKIKGFILKITGGQ